MTSDFFVANTFQIQPFHKGLAKRADVAFWFMPGFMTSEITTYLD
jgi:hypothetical protein